MGRRRRPHSLLLLLLLLPRDFFPDLCGIWDVLFILAELGIFMPRPFFCVGVPAVFLLGVAFGALDALGRPRGAAKASER